MNVIILAGDTILAGVFHVGTDQNAANPNEYSRNVMKEVFALRRQVSHFVLTAVSVFVIFNMV